MMWFRCLGSLLLCLSALPASAQAACAPLPAELTADTTLVPGCVYHQGITIAQPLTLDCQGAIFDGEGRVARGLTIDSRGQPLAGVTVRRCTFRRFARDGVLIHWGLPNDLKIARYPDREKRWRRAPQDVHLEDLRVEQNDVMGIVIDDYVQRVTLDHVAVIDNPGWGLYWDHDSRGHLLIHSEVRGNGHGSRLGKPGLSIDAAADSRVIDTRFQANARAAIELYRNCWENAATDPHSVLRETGANGNQILGNYFADEAVGVWIAARQSRDVSAMHCGRPAYVEGRYVEDEARHNIVAQNRFERLRGPAIIVEDDANSVVGNSFDHGAGAVQVGTPIRTRVLHHPVRNTLLQGNHADDGEAPVRVRTFGENGGARE